MLSAEPSSPSPSGIRINRRSLIAGALGVVAGWPLAACTTSGSGGGSSAIDSALLPTYRPYLDVEPDLPGETGRSTASFFSYPAEPVRFSSGVPGDGRPIRAMVPSSFALPPGRDRNPFWQELDRRLGSELDLSIVTASDYTTAFSTAVAGDKLPDMFHVGSVQSLPAFMERKAADLTSQLSGDAIEKYPGLANLPTDSWKACIFGGAIRAIPISRGLTNLGVLFARTDRLSAIGATQPANFEELLALSKELTSPRARRWALGGAPVDFVRSMLDIPSPWRVDGDTFVSTRTDERQQQALEALRTLHQAGVIHPDADTVGGPVKKGWLGAGTIAMAVDSFVAWFSLYGTYATPDNPDFAIQALDIPGFDGGQGTQFVPIPNVGITAINQASSDRVESLLKVADWLCSPFGTEEYLFLKYGQPGVHYRLEGSDPIPEKKAGDIQIGALYLGDAARVLYSPGRRDVIQAAHDYQTRATSKAVSDPTLGLYSETAGRRGASLEAALSSAASDIIAGRKPVADWTGAVDAYLSGGGRTIAEEYTRAHAEAQARG